MVKKYIISENQLNLIFENLKSNVYYHGSKFSKIDFNKKNEHPDYNMLGFGLYLTNSKQEAIYYAGDDKNYIHYISVNDSNLFSWDDVVPDNIKSKLLKTNNFLKPFNTNYNIKDNYLKFGDFELIWDIVDEPLPDWVNKSGYFIILEKNGKQVVSYFGLSYDDLIKNLDAIINEYKPTKDSIDVSNMDISLYGLLNVYELSQDDIFKSIKHLYLYLTLLYKSYKKASFVFVNLGVDGVYINIDTSDYNDTSSPKTIVIYNPELINVLKTEKL